METLEQPAKVLTERYTTRDGKVIGHLVLNKPKSLNALDLDMAQMLFAQLTAWQHDNEVVAVLLSGAGDKAFCAGGDIVSMYQAMQQAPNTTPAFLSQFFIAEYQLDYLIHRYPKPLIVWGQGIVMGGGMGLLMGASHRVLTPSSRLAMPEITIGLYPDVGASYVLPRMPSVSGLFVGLTGVHVNAADAQYLGLATHLCIDGQLPSLIERLCASIWQDTSASDVIEQCLRAQALPPADIPEGNLAPRMPIIEEVLDVSQGADAIGALLRLSEHPDAWLQKAARTFAAGSPITARLVMEQYQRGQHMSLAECFRMELDLSCRCGEYGEFQEGVRALLIDKDRQPKWAFSSVKEVPASVIDWFFSSPWPDQEHPLAHLGA